MSLSALAYKKLEVIQNVVSYHVALERETKLVENVLISNTEIPPKPQIMIFSVNLDIQMVI